MDGYEFQRRLKRLALGQGITVRYDTHGKGSHGRIYFGARFTTIKDRRKEISKGLLAAMCKQLNINPSDL
jgi:mRNA interferase HicA